VSRYFPPPKEYRPGLVLDLRQKPEGGLLQDPGLAYIRTGYESRRECLVMIHGFNNHQGEAAQAYLGFRNRQRGNYPKLTEAWLEGFLGDAFWPGDADWAGPLDLLDFMCYPQAVHTAVKAGPLLADLITYSISGLERVYFIGHSLGCRVVLETAALIQKQGFPDIGGICLMAAAVQTDMVEPGGRFDRFLANLGGMGAPVLVLYSHQDLVLMLTFPPGQTMAGEGVLPGALGYFGPPPDMAGRVSRLKISGASHGDYWGHSGTKASYEATKAAGQFFKLGEEVRRIETRAAGEAREAGSPRTVGGT
jgi:hypothetical protein